MIASLYQSWSWLVSRSMLICGARFMRCPSRIATEQESGVLRLIDAQADAPPFEQMAFAGHQVFNRSDAAARIRRADLEIAEMEPELARAMAGDRHRRRHRIVARDRLLDEADDLLVVHLHEAEIARLQKRGVLFADPVEPADIVGDVAGLVPVAHFDLVFLRVQVLLLARNGLMLQELEAVADPVIGGKRRGQRDARLEDPGLARLQVDGIDIRRVDEEIGPE